MKDKNNNDNKDTVVESKSAMDALKVLVESNESFDDSFLEEVSTIFAGGLTEAIKAKGIELAKANEAQQAEYQEAFAEKIDSYLTHAAEAFIEENELAVDTAIKTQISEDFLTGLKGLFSEHYVELPEGKADLYEEASDENKRLNEELDEKESEVVKLQESLETFTRKDIFNTVSEGMSDTDKERFEELIESVEYETAAKYESKLGILRKAFIDKESSTNEDTNTDDSKDTTFLEDLSGGEDDDKNVVQDPLVARVLASLKSN